MSTTRVSRSSAGKSFVALAGVCSLLAGLALTTGVTRTDLGVGWGVSEAIAGGACVFVIDENGVAHCHIISGDWKPGDPVPPEAEEPPSEVEVTAEADDAFHIGNAAAAETGAHSDDVPPPSSR